MSGHRCRFHRKGATYRPNVEYTLGYDYASADKPTCRAKPSNLGWLWPTLSRRSARHCLYLCCCGVAAGDEVCAGSCGGGTCLGATPRWSMLSEDCIRLGSRKLITKLRTRKMPARIVVILPKKSAVRRTPKTVPICAPPNVPANPPPLLDCIKTTTISKILTITSTDTRIPNMVTPFCLSRVSKKPLP